AERQIVNVAPGAINSTSTDAINGSQLYSVAENIDNRITNIDERVTNIDNSISGLKGDIKQASQNADAGTASALAAAGLPQSILPGKGMTAIAASTYGGESALAIGVSKVTDNAKWVFKATGTINTRKKVGVAVGAGFHW
ncbi:MAG: YadA-like family protein, partial [Formosimonas sp.]